MFTNKFYAGISIIAMILLIACHQAQTNTNIVRLAPESYSEKLQAQTTPQLLDVRTPKEFQSGHLPNAVNVDWSGDVFKDQTSALDKSKPVFVYCMGGGRSSDAADFLAKEGFKEVYDLEGGFNNWEKSFPENIQK
ncbi:MAG: rhodanese-like domain-containing protein [Bacteroidota bacterium]|nr:rhodanese-like domain-containing protein [Bacteroidota bacterium]